MIKTGSAALSLFARFLIAFASLAVASGSIGAPLAFAVSVAERAHIKNVNEANKYFYEWQREESRLQSRPGVDRGFDFFIERNKAVNQRRSAAEMERSKRTHELVLEYYGHQGLHRHMGIFIESGAANTGNYQWNTQRWAGFKIKALRDKFLDRARAEGILNIRLGHNLHEIDVRRKDTIEEILDFHREAWQRGISVTDSVMFFTGLKELESLNPDGTVDPTRSYQNHPGFVSFAEKRASFILEALFKEAALFNAANESRPPAERLPPARIAVNPINEPETFAGFNHFWNRGFANWGDPNRMALYVPAIINIAKANVRIRLATERAARGQRVLYFHNEAMTPRDYPTHEGDLQFAISKLMLGDDQLMNADFAALAREPLAQMKDRFESERSKGVINIVEACILKFAMVPQNNSEQKIEEARASVIRQLRELRDEHLNHQVVSGKTAKTDTLLMLDYYQQSEFRLPKPVPQVIKDLSANHGELLKQVLRIRDDRTFMQELENKARVAEEATGQKIWHDYRARSSIDFEAFLEQEDGIMLDKLIGLRNNWSINSEAVYEQRRQAVGFHRGLIHSSDENRDDAFLNSVLANDAELLKRAMGAANDAELRSALASAGAKDLSLSLRAILNADQRRIFHSLFGLQRDRLSGFLPPHYAAQTRLNMRLGFAQTFTNYVTELGIGVGGIGESGTPYYPWAAPVQKQMFLALTAAAKAANFYIVRSDIGPALGTVGWMSGPLTGTIKENGRRGEDGVFKLVRTAPKTFDYQLSAWRQDRPWYQVYRDDLIGGLTRAQERLSRAPECEAALKSK